MRMSNETRAELREAYREGLKAALARASAAYEKEKKFRLDNGCAYPEAVHHALDAYDACIAEFKRNTSD